MLLDGWKEGLGVPDKDEESSFWRTVARSSHFRLGTWDKDLEEPRGPASAEECRSIDVFNELFEP
jgi:hypothetical protein